MLFVCRQCDAPEGGCDCETRQAGDDGKRGKRSLVKGAPEAMECVSRLFEPQIYVNSSNAASKSAIRVVDVRKLLDTADALKRAAAAVLHEKKIGLTANGRTKEAFRVSMRHYMRRYRGRKRAEALAASEAADTAEAA